MTDFLDQDKPLAEPEVQIIHKGFLHWIKENRTIFAASLVVIIIIGTFLLSFFNIISLQNTLYLFKNQPNPTSKYVIPAKFDVTCALPDGSCLKQISVKYKTDPASIAKLPSGTQVKSIAPVIDSQEFISPHGDNSLKGVRQTYSQQENCYTVTYTLPTDAIINTITFLPFAQGSVIATLGEKLYSLSGYQANFIIQVQKMPLEKIATGSGALSKCTVNNLKIGNFGEYEQPKN